jgi:hypothetical protein
MLDMSGTLKISMLRTFLMIYHRYHGKMWHNMKIQTPVGNYENPFTCKYLIAMHHLDACMRIRRNSLPWITPNIKNLMKARDFHKKKAVKFNSQLHWAKYKDTRNKVNSELSVQSQKEVFLRQI